MVESPELFDDS